MPFVGLGLHLVLALVCAMHVVRHGQPLYWLVILFSFPLLGSLVYILMVYLPNSRLERSARKAITSAAKALDPTKEVRRAQADFEHTPTAQNQMRLAAALLEAGDAPGAARQYEACLQGPFAQDADIRIGAAKALVECGRFADAMPHLQWLQTTRADYRPDQVLLLLARSLAGLSMAAEARAAFEQALVNHGTFEAHAEYAIWALSSGDEATAVRLQAEMDKMMKRWNLMSRTLNEPMLRRLSAARQPTRQAA